MPPARCGSALCCASAMTLALLCAGESAAQTVWSGLTFSFTKASADPTLPANQDRITDNVWLTRDVVAGIFNINQETAYAIESPADTEWATYLNNDGEFDATDWASLTFENWITAYGGQGSQELPARLTGGNAVVHLITDDVYLDLQFTSWTIGGGGFSYDRAVGQLPPTTTGDYNGNGVVDAADYVIWRKTLSQPAVPAGSGADGDADGTIDSGDYTFWAGRFGNIVPGSGSGSFALAAPEPTAIVLVLIGLAFANAVSRKRRC